MNPTLALEYSTVDADIAGGIVRAGITGELIMEPDGVDVAATKFEPNGEK